MNRVYSVHIDSEECPCIEGRDRVFDAYSAYLADESRIATVCVDAIYFPVNTAQVVDAVGKIRGRGETIIVSGARTGITGGAVGVDGAAIISLEKMNAVLGEWRFQAGVRLEDIPKGNGVYYPVDPTEMTASLGGTVATDASGARSYYYGSTRCFVKKLTVVLADGSVLNMTRGEVTGEDGCFLIDTAAGEMRVPIEDTCMPPVKNTAGLYLKNGMDIIDLFIGSEGTLGIVTEIEIDVAPLPEDRLFLVVYAGSEEQAVSLVESVKADDALEALAIEYFDANALKMLRTVENVAVIPEDADCALYLELLGEGEGLEDHLAAALESCGLDMDSTWAGFDEKDLQEMKRFRHAVPETINSLIGKRRADIPDLHKIGTDTSVPEGRLREFLSFAREQIEGRGVEYVVFGHIGDNHLHINMIPSSKETLDAAKELYLGIARRSVELGGSVSAEHGIGRLKKHFLEIQFGAHDLSAMRAVKDALDPDGILNPGVMF